MQLHRVAFPAKHTEMNVIVAHHDSVACHCTTSATHTAQYFDAAPTGKKVVMHEMLFNRILDVRLCKTWSMVDGTDFYDQITSKPAPEQLDNTG